MNCKSMATMASQFYLTFDICIVLLLHNMNINCEKKSKIKSNKLKMARDLKVISKEEFKIKVRVILEL
jgi:hypothetical protein